ncbi:MAG: hypothetical protein INR64_05335, partial [Caulobacteraceae bacterium]|nr:hypothetical protein [Caulobacter sp.]
LDPGAAPDASARVFDRTLPAGLGTVRATATGPDGSVYLLADVNGPTPDGQALQGAQDVALVKYDSAGQLVFTRTLGAAQSASGYALAVSLDGGEVAIAGAVTGDLDPGDAPAAGATSSFVQVFDGAGQALWDQRSPATGEQPKAISFAADGSLLVSGATHTDLQTPSAQGGYVRSYAAVKQTAFDGTSLGYRVSTASAAAPAGPVAGVLALPGGGSATAAVQNGHAILSLYAGPLAAGAQPTAVRDLGDLGGGALAGLALGADGSLVVAGTSGSGALQAGAVTTAYGGGQEAFVAKLSPDLQPSDADRTSYVALGGDTTATGVAVEGGRVYLAGQVAGAPALGQTGPSHTGYALALDPDTGEVGWSQTLGGADGQVAPAGIAVAAGGVSALDALGLPSGPIDYTPSPLVTANTAARAGDSFTVRVGVGAPVKVTLAADDTLQTLAAKISRATGFAATATASAAVGGARSQLTIAPATPSASLTLQAGPGGSDLLAALGLPEGVVQAAATTRNTRNAVPATPYALGLSSSLSVATAAGAKAAAARLQAAMATVQKAYTDLVTPPASATAKAATSSVSAYTQSRLADYQLALQRLTGSS